MIKNTACCFFVVMGGWFPERKEENAAVEFSHGSG